jgi:phosphatidylglycerophosphatase A
MVQQKATSIFKSFKFYSRKKAPVPEKVWHDPLYFIAFGLGSGAAPVAPGTFGTLLAIPIYLLLQHLPLYMYLMFLVVFTLFSAWLSDRISREIRVHDHPGMNLDEFVGFFVTMINAPFGIGWIILGFLLFRLFDIWKPWPIDLIDEKVQGGFGMVLDDIFAGIFAMIIIQYVKEYF